MIITKADMCLSLQRALLGEIYPEIRIISFRHNPIDSSFTLLYILDREPTEEDYAVISIVLTEFMADFNYNQFSEFHEKCLYNLAKVCEIQELKEMDMIVYARKEL